MSKKTRRLLIGLLSALVLGAGCIGWAYADEEFDLSLEKHSADHECQGTSHGVMDRSGNNYAGLEATCYWMNETLTKACWYHYSPGIYLFVDDAEYDGKPHGGTLKWKWGEENAPDTDFHTIKMNGPTNPDPRLLGVTIWNFGHDGDMLNGERYIGTEAPTQPGTYRAGSLIQFESIEEEDNFRLVSPDYIISPKVLTLDWSGETEFPYDGQAHAPTVEIPADQIVGDDVVSVTRTVESAPGVYTATADLSGKDRWKYTISDDSLEREYAITAPYEVKFDSNPPEKASTKDLLTGHMDNQKFDYAESKELTENTYDLPGYEFLCWNTQADGQGKDYADKATVEKLGSGDTVTLYAKWQAKKYKLLFREKDASGAKFHEQWATFDEAGTLDKYSTDWWPLPDSSMFRGWWCQMGKVQLFYEDECSYYNICPMKENGAPEMDDFGNIVGVMLNAEYIYQGQIVVTVRLDGAKQVGLKDYLTVEATDGSSTFDIPLVQDSGNYVYDPSKVEPSHGDMPALAPGHYKMVLDTDCSDMSDPLYRFAVWSMPFTYGNPDEDDDPEITLSDGAPVDPVSIVFDYYSLNYLQDPAYKDYHRGDIGHVPGNTDIPRVDMSRPGTVIAPEDSEVLLRTEIVPDSGYHFEEYTVTGVEPQTKDYPYGVFDVYTPEQTIIVKGTADIMAHPAGNVYYVTFDPNGKDVEGAMEDQDMVVGEPQNLFINQFTRKNAVFAGWNTEPDDSGKSYEDGDRVQNLTTEEEGLVTLYAQWIMQDDPGAPAEVLIAQAKAKGKKALSIKWNKLKAARGYDIYMSRCNKGGKTRTPKLVKTINSGNVTSWKRSGLQAKNCYKVYVMAWKIKDGKKTYINKSPLVHVYTSGGRGKYTNAKSVTVNAANVSLNTGGTFTIKAKVKKVKKSKKLMPQTHVKKLRYLSSDPAVATVNPSGQITAKAPGMCMVYVYASSGVKKAVKVNVKELTEVVTK